MKMRMLLPAAAAALCMAFAAPQASAADAAVQAYVKIPFGASKAESKEQFGVRLWTETVDPFRRDTAYAMSPSELNAALFDQDRRFGVSALDITFDAKGAGKLTLNGQPLLLSDRDGVRLGLEQQQYYYFGGAVLAAGLGVGICWAVGCFDDDDDYEEPTPIPE